MIQVFPTIDYVFECPLCGRGLENGGFLMTGMRNLVDVFCPACRKSWYCDFPSGHGLLYPFFIEKKTGKLEQTTNWFGRLLTQGYAQQDTQPVQISVETYGNHSQVVILNCLDFLYGHCLIKLLNVQRYLDHGSVPVAVIVPRQLRHLVPASVGEVWTVELPIRKLTGWFVSLEEQFKHLMRAKEICYLAVVTQHLDPDAYDLERFQSPDFALDYSSSLSQQPVVTFVYREDRLWGKSIQHQIENIEELYAHLESRLGSFSFVVAGIGRAGKLTDRIQDWRVERFTLDDERKLLDLYRESQCVVGVHGSNMLLPSGLARIVVELLPESRFGCAYQSWLTHQELDSPYDYFFRYTAIPGDEHLLTIKPNVLASFIYSKIIEYERFRLYIQQYSKLKDVPVSAARVRSIVDSFSQFREPRAVYVTRSPSNFVHRLGHRVRRWFLGRNS